MCATLLEGIKGKSNRTLSQSFTELRSKSKKKYYSNLNVKGITDNKKFWIILKPLVSDKTKPVVSITFKQNKKMRVKILIFLMITFQKFYIRFNFQNLITSMK